MIPFLIAIIVICTLVAGLNQLYATAYHKGKKEGFQAGFSLATTAVNQEDLP